MTANRGYSISLSEYTIYCFVLDGAAFRTRQRYKSNLIRSKFILLSRFNLLKFVKSHLAIH